MNLSQRLARPDWLPALEAWAARAGTLRAMVLLIAARLLITGIPFRIWRKWLGGNAEVAHGSDVTAARRLAAQVNRAGWRLPFVTKCLPRAMALSWMLRRIGVGHRLVFAVRPAHHRGGDDDLHAWVEVGGAIVLGELTGPWLRMLEQGG